LISLPPWKILAYSGSPTLILWCPHYYNNWTRS